MLVSDFNYRLPDELIARHPASERDASRLMVLQRQTNQIAEDIFKNVPAYLKPGDLLVMNDTRVIPARLHGRKSTGGAVEIFLVRREPVDVERWICLLRGSKGLKDGQVLTLSAGMRAVVLGRRDAESWLVEFYGEASFQEWLECEGHMPLPPYLRRSDDSSDRERYQTVFARAPGAVAAPTAGLHFTAALLAEIQKKDISVEFLTLHTGLGTFQPVRVERVEDHRIHIERFSIPVSTADAIRATKKRGGRVVAVGTTTARTLEFAADDNGNLRPGEGEADIFIYPGYRFKVIDALITNFHLPESTLLMMVSAFAGQDFVLQAYYEAINRNFRFYSYGDAMLIC